MSTRAELVDAIRRAGDDDPEPVLVYADWLMDRDDPRGEYLAIEHGGGDPGRRDELLQRHQREWLAPIEELGAFRPGLDRGLVRFASLRGRHAANLAAICELEPIGGASIDSTGVRPARELVASGALRNLRSLLLGGSFDTGAELILGSPDIAGVDWLSVFHRIDEGRARALVASGVRPRHAHIDPEPEATAILAAAQTFERLRALDAPGPAIAQLGARLDRLVKLESVAIDAAVDALVRHVRSGNLRELDCRIDSDDAQVKLLSSPVLAGVEALDLQATELCPAAIRALQRSPHIKKLRSMWLPDQPSARRFTLPGVEIEWEGW